MSGDHLPGDRYLYELSTRAALLDAFDRTSAGDIVDTFRYTKAGTPPADETAIESFITDSDAFFEALYEYPKQNAEKAHAVLNILANSPASADREEAGYLIDGLTTVDSVNGLVLWRQLARDYDPEVRQSAFGRLEACFDCSDPEEELAEIGLSLADAIELRSLRKQADEGLNLHDPRRAAVARLLGNLTLPRE